MSRPPLDPAKTTAGIAVDPQTLDRVIPESRRSDGTVRKQIKIRPGFTPQEDVRRFRGTRQIQMDVNTLPKGHIIGWVPPPTSTSTSGTPSTKSAKKNAKKKAKKIAQRNGNRDEEEEGDVSDKQEDVPENWEDDGDESGPQGSNSGIPDTNASMTTTDLVEPAKENQQVSPADVERDLSSELDKLNVK